MTVIQFVYSMCFPEIYSLIDKRGINLRSEFLLTFKQWKDKKNFPAQQQQPQQRPTAAASSSSSSDAGTSFGELENKENDPFSVRPNQNFSTNCLGLNNNVDEKKKAGSKRKVLGEKNTGTEKRNRKTQPSEKELRDCLDTLNKKFAVAREHNKKNNKAKKKLVI